MIGRTHGVHAEPMTLRAEAGALVRGGRARHRARAARPRGRVASARSRAPSAPTRTSTRRSRRAVCAALGLEPAPVSSQVIQRDRHAELLCGARHHGASLEKFALEIRGLQKTEIGEVEEPFAKGQKGSSAMPHKRNPIGCEQIVGLARAAARQRVAALENVALWHERDISHSSVERIILPDSFIALDHMLRRFTRIVAGHGGLPRADAREPRAARAAWSSPGTVLLALAVAGRLARAGLRVGAAQRDAVVRTSGARLPATLLRADADLAAVLPGRATSIGSSTSTHQLRHVDERSSGACSATEQADGR